MDGGEHDVDELEDVECDSVVFWRPMTDSGVDAAALCLLLRSCPSDLFVLLDLSLLNFLRFERLLEHVYQNAVVCL